MSDKEIYSSYTQARDPKKQIKVLQELNACKKEDVLQAVSRYQQYLDDREAQRSHESESVQHDDNATIVTGKEVQWTAKKPLVKFKESETIKVRIVDRSIRHSEPTPGIGPLKDSLAVSKRQRGPDKHVRWRKRTVIHDQYDLDWNRYIDSMRSHLEQAKECEKQLIRLEKEHGSHRRKRKETNSNGRTQRAGRKGRQHNQSDETSGI